jgi:photosystem II stability/assembly factor-like uncharacterized protein
MDVTLAPLCQLVTIECEVPVSRLKWFCGEVAMSQRLAGFIGLLFLLVFVGAAAVLSESMHSSFVPMTIGGSTSQLPTPTSTPVPTTTPIAAWKSLGLEGEPISDIATSHRTIYVATKGYRHGIFKSENLGQKWYVVNNGLLNLDLDQVEVAENDKSIVFAISGGIAPGFWRSIDAGITWLPFELDCSHVRQPLALRSASGMSIAVICYDVYFVSDDGGKSWEFTWNRDHTCGQFPYTRTAQIDRSIVYIVSRNYVCLFAEPDYVYLAGVGPNLTVNDLAASYWDPDSVFVATDQGVYHSNDRGLEWVPINNSLPQQGFELRCLSVQASPWEPSGVYVLCEGQVFESRDNGTSWTLIDAPAELMFLHAMIEPKLLLAASKDEGLWAYELP